MVKSKNRTKEGTVSQSIRTQNGRNDTLNADSEAQGAMELVANVNKATTSGKKKPNVKNSSDEVMKKTKGRTVSKATFSEGDETVHMELEGDDFPSEGENNSQVSEFETQDEEIEARSRSSAAEYSDNEQRSQTPASEPGEINSSRETSRDRSRSRARKRKQKRRAKNKCKRRRKRSPSSSSYLGTSESSSSTSQSRSCSRSKAKRRSRSKRAHETAQFREQLNCINETVKTLQSVVMNSGMFNEAGRKNRPKGKQGKDPEVHSLNLPHSVSNTTIYRDLLKHSGDSQAEGMVEQVIDPEVSFQFKKNCGSTSSEDNRVNTSDELVNVDCERFIAECAVRAHDETNQRSIVETGDDSEQLQPDPYRRGEQMKKDAEGLNTRRVAPPGNELAVMGNSLAKAGSSSQFDEEYMAIGGHVDGLLQEKNCQF